MQEPSTANEATAKNALIRQYRSDYEASLLAMDSDVRKLVEDGKEMQAVLLFGQCGTRILAVYEALTEFYTAIYNSRNVLKRFKSRSLKDLGFELQEPYGTVVEFQRAMGEYGKDPDEIVIDRLNKLGFKKGHWFIDPRILMEIEYMFHCLNILIEPDFVPLQVDDGQVDETHQDRYISSAVKIAVWRRDQGKCVDCGSKEKLEYDHIIPVTKGGSNTERNVQLLCQNCNRQKSANIQ